MRICIVSSTVFPSPPFGYSGLEMITWLQAKGLAERGHKVSLVAPDGSFCPNVEIIPTGPAGQHDEKSAYSRVWQHYAQQDVILDSTWQKWTYVGKQEGWLAAPILGWMHAPVNTMYQSLPPVEKPCIVCISRDQASHFEALYGREARVCWNGCDPSFYQPLGIPRSDRYLFLARFSSVKSPDLCEDVCLAAGVGLDLVGDTSITNEPEYLEKCRRKADGKQVRIIGGVSRGEAVHWMSQARGFLHFTPNFREPFGLAPVEAMLCECPVLAWKYGALKETILHGETGFLVSSQQESIDLLKAKALDSIDRKKCREWAMQFSVENMVKRCEELCKEAIEMGGW